MNKIAVIQDEILDAIDASNNVIGTVGKLESYRQKVPHRVVHVMVLDGKNIFLVRRGLSVRYLPGFYCSSAGGHVQAGEDVTAAANRELAEEIGLCGPLEHLEGFFFMHEFKVHVDLYLKKFDPSSDSIVLHPDEVMSGAFYSLEEIAALDLALFHPQLIPCLAKVAAYLGR